MLCPGIDPLGFLAGCRRRRLNQGLVVEDGVGKDNPTLPYPSRVLSVLRQHTFARNFTTQSMHPETKQITRCIVPVYVGPLSVNPNSNFLYHIL